MLPVNLIEILLHIDLYLSALIQDYGLWVYAILFIIIFLETGFVVTPFLPGDSLLFVAGAFAATGSLNALWLIVLLSVAAILGDTVNYWIGYHLGLKALNKLRFVKKEYLERTEKFYERHGKKTIVIARFIPIIRTFAPFVAGIGKMKYNIFLAYNVFGGIFWVAIFIAGGYYFGGLPIVKENFGLILLGIIFASLVAAFFGILRSQKHADKSPD